jgi:hypothetical protein
VEDGTIWLTQLEVAELFQTTKNNVSIRTRNIFAEGDLTPEATVKESLTVQNEGNRQVKRTIAYYNLDLILAIGYRFRSPRGGTQFRQWATTHLREFLVKGFVMDDHSPERVPLLSNLNRSQTDAQLCESKHASFRIASNRQLPPRRSADFSSWFFRNFCG